MPRVLILGGGFGGLYAAAHLARSAERDIQVMLVDRKNYFTFTPLLAEVAEGHLGPEHVTYPFRVLARQYGFDFVRDTVQRLHPDRQIVETVHAELDYDYLILSTGGEPQYFGNEAVRNQSLSLMSVEEAVGVRERVVESLERAQFVEDKAALRRLLTFVVAGAGPAGVEVASAIHNLANTVLRPYYQADVSAHVILAATSDRILIGFDDALAGEGLRRLRDRGVEVRLNTRIVDATPDTITAQTPDGRQPIPSCTLIWTAGTTPGGWMSSQPIPMNENGVRIDPYLRVYGYDNIFAVGDVTALVDERAGRQYPKVAPIAISQGVRAAANIENAVLRRRLEPYQAYHAGKIVSLGGGVALVDILGFRMTGPIAWWIYRVAYLLKLVGMKNKARVILTLLLNRIFEPDISA